MRGSVLEKQPNRRGSWIGRSWLLLPVSTRDMLEPCYLTWIQHEREAKLAVRRCEFEHWLD